MTFYLNFNFTFQGHMGATACGTPLLALTVLPISLGVFIMYSGFLLKDELVKITCLFFILNIDINFYIFQVSLIKLKFH